jgi:Transglutaminase-like superfamily
MPRLVKFFHLPSREQWLLVRAVFVVGGIRLGLWTLPFATVRAIVAGVSKRHAVVGPPSFTPEKIAWAVASASRFVPRGSNCLVRAVSTELILKRLGHPCELKIGVARTEAGAITAHAWLESEGRIVIGNFDLGRYSALAPPEAGRL